MLKSVVKVKIEKQIMIFEFFALYSLKQRFNFTPNTSGILKKEKDDGHKKQF